MKEPTFIVNCLMKMNRLCLITMFLTGIAALAMGQETPPPPAEAATNLPAVVPPPVAPPPALAPAPVRSRPTPKLPVPTPALQPVASGTVPPPEIGRDVSAGAFDEEANLDLPSAMAKYQQAIGRFDALRPEAALAVFRLAEAERKLGRMEEAKVQYARILREFPDQAALVDESRKYLSAPGGIAGASTFQSRLNQIVQRASADPPADSSFQMRLQRIVNRAAADEPGDASVQARLNQIVNRMAAPGEVELIQRQIDLAEQQLKAAHRQVEVGAAPTDSAILAERELLNLKRELVRVEADLARQKEMEAGISSKSMRRYGVEADLARQKEMEASLAAAPALSAEGDYTRQMRSGGGSGAGGNKPLGFEWRVGTPPASGPAEKEASSRNRMIELKRQVIEGQVARLENQVLEKTEEIERNEHLLNVVGSKNPANLPDAVVTSPMYHELKQAYAKAVTEGDNGGRDIALKKMEDWVQNVYMEQLKSQLEFAVEERGRLLRTEDRLKSELVELAAQEAKEAADMAKQAQIEEREKRAAVVLFSGEVNGAMPVTAGEELTLSQAIVRLGASKLADLKKVRLMRSQESGGIETRVVNVAAVLTEGQASADVVLKPGDKVFVPAKIF